MSGHDLETIRDAEDLLDHPDPYHIPYPALQALQLRLLQRWFVAQHAHIPVLRRVAERKHLATITHLAEVVPLLFSHATYKTYPESLLDSGAWQQMNRWVATLTTRGQELQALDVTGVRSLDDWLTLLDRHGFALAHSSGTSGKPSFLPKSASEQAAMCRAYCAAFRWGQGVDPARDKMPVLCVTFQHGWSVIVRRTNDLAAAYAPTPGAILHAFAGVQSPTQLRRQSTLRRLMAAGRLDPAARVTFEQEVRQQQAATAASLEAFVQRMHQYRGQRVMLLGHTATIFQLATRLLAAGEHALFAPDSLVIHGGGTKGLPLPDDYATTLMRFAGVPQHQVVNLYGMTERNSTPLVCAAGRKHCSPWEIPLLLDRDAAHLLNPPWGTAGIIEGRYAFVDLLAKTYWGGIVTGDQVAMHFDRCPCGREGPQILAIRRYTDDVAAPDEDKLSCAVEMAGYVADALGTSGG